MQLKDFFNEPVFLNVIILAFIIINFRHFKQALCFVIYILNNNMNNFMSGIKLQQILDFLSLTILNVILI